MSKSRRRAGSGKTRNSRNRATRSASVPVLEFDPALPINQRLDDLKEAISAHQVVIICGETGSGKSTQIPKICLELGRGINGFIGHTQPRRIAAKSIAARLSEEIRVPANTLVAHKIRFEDRSGERTLIKVVTDGMLLSEIRSDRRLDQYDTIIIDEAHERSLNIDFLLGYIKSLLPRRPDLKLIVTSATIDPESFSRFFDAAPVIEVSGRMYPVEVRYRPASGEGTDRPLPMQIGDAIDELAGSSGGDVLVFLPGERDIRDVREHLQKLRLRDTEILPLFGRLAMRDQRRVFSPHKGRRIVLATNVAETSLTVPGITSVVDSGLVRISRYSTGRQVLRLPIEPVSRASADQRKGRCGRVQSGICIRLFSEDDFDNRPEYTEPEIHRTSLAAVILTMLDLEFGDIRSFPFIDPPAEKAINEGYRLLHELGAVDESRRITQTGSRLAHFPVDPRIARMLLSGAETGCLAEILVIAAYLSAQDPREYPQDAIEEARRVHKRWEVESSDFLTVLKIWSSWQKVASQATNREKKAWQKKRFLSSQRMREWSEIHRQLGELASDQGLQTNSRAASDEKLHSALLAGLLGNIATKDDRHEYLGTRGKRLYIHPGSATFDKPPRWLMAAELVDTSRLYARMVAEIQPDWVEDWAGELVSRNYLNPRWSRKKSRVIADEQVSLFGLIVIVGRPVNYGPVNPAVSRELFIRRGLVDGEYQSRSTFLENNQQLLDQLENLESRTRRRDILVDDETRFRFYDDRLPEDIFDGASFEVWLRDAEKDNPGLLAMSESDLLIRGTADLSLDRFPEFLDVDENRFLLSYHFEPGHALDGVTVSIPVTVLQQTGPMPFDWLVPGLILEKIIALIRGLPKPIRRQCVPAPDIAVRCLEYLDDQMSHADSLNVSLARALSGVTQAIVSAGDFDESGLADHLRMNYRIVDENGEEMGQSRDLDLLKRQLAVQAREVFEASADDDSIERSGLTAWDFDMLPEAVRIRRGVVTLSAWPALVDCDDSVAIRLFDNPVEARDVTIGGLRRIFSLTYPSEMRYLGKNLPGLKKMSLDYATMGSSADLRNDLVNATLDRCYEIRESPPRTRLDFEERCHFGKPRLIPVANTLCANIEKILHSYAGLRAGLDKLSVPTRADVREQLAYLLYPGFISTTPEGWLQRYPVYMKGIEERIERAVFDPEKDLQKMKRLAGLVELLESGFEASWEDGVEQENFFEFRWMLEEYRLSIFAQHLRTVTTVSAKRLALKAEEVAKSLSE